jgi:hypothetical protein
MQESFQPVSALGSTYESIGWRNIAFAPTAARCRRSRFSLWVGFAFDQSSVAVPQFRYPQKQFVGSSGDHRLLGRGLKPTFKQSLLTNAVSQTDPSHLATTLLNPIFHEW